MHDGYGETQIFTGICTSDWLKNFCSSLEQVIGFFLNSWSWFLLQEYWWNLKCIRRDKYEKAPSSPPIYFLPVLSVCLLGNGVFFVHSTRGFGSSLGTLRWGHSQSPNLSQEVGGTWWYVPCMYVYIYIYIHIYFGWEYKSRMSSGC